MSGVFHFSDNLISVPSIVYWRWNNTLETPKNKSKGVLINLVLCEETPKNKSF